MGVDFLRVRPLEVRRRTFVPTALLAAVGTRGGVSPAPGEVDLLAVRDDEFKTCTDASLIVLELLGFCRSERVPEEADDGDNEAESRAKFIASEIPSRGCAPSGSVDRLATDRAELLMRPESFEQAESMQGFERRSEVTRRPRIFGTSRRALVTACTLYGRDRLTCRPAMDEAAFAKFPKIAVRTGYLALLSNLAMLSACSNDCRSHQDFGGRWRVGSTRARRPRMAEGISEAMNCTAFASFVIIRPHRVRRLNGKTHSSRTKSTRRSCRF